jgi:sulfide:quinone oxidoreductase
VQRARRPRRRDRNATSAVVSRHDSRSGAVRRAGYAGPVKIRIVVLGAGFGGLELSTMLSEALGEDVEVTLIDKSDAFVFGFSKLDVLFGRTTLDAVRVPYRELSKPGVRFLQQTVTAIDPDTRTVTTEDGVYEADVLVVALGADYDFAATPGLAEAGNEFYSVAGAARLAELLPTFTAGRAIIGVCGAPFKCPPAPSETALLLHDYLSTRGVRDDCEISFVLPLGSPVPPSPETSRALVAAFAERGIELVTGRRISSLDPSRRVAILDDAAEMPYELFLGVPVHRAPDVVIASGMTVDGYVPVDSATLETRFPGVYAIGDVATVGAPKAGVFAEGAARIVAESLIARVRGGEQPGPYDGRGICYIEFGAGRVGRVEVDFLSGPKPTGWFGEPSEELVAEKRHFGSSRRARWFGL